MEATLGSIEPTAPGWYMVRYSEFGSIEARFYDENGWQVVPGVTSLFGEREGDVWWDVCSIGKQIPDWAIQLYENE